LRTPDIERVGRTARHCTFFEMLGNFSFGDYFKAEAIEWAWTFVTSNLGLPKERLWVTIYLDDDEAAALWQEKAGIPAERIVRLGKEDNFWEIGVGPCGPCSEIYVDRGEKYGCGKPDCGPACGCDRYMEIWNLVFIQFHKDEAGEYHPLEKKSIDTGMGLDRLAVITQGVDNVFETDLLKPVLAKVTELSGVDYGRDPEQDMALRVVTEHSRSVTFMVKDGILPSNEGRGYVLRRLLRRALRYGRRINIEGLFLYKVADRVIEIMGSAYPDLVQRRQTILDVIRQEEERFRTTLEQGMNIFNEMSGEVRRKGETTLSGRDAFKLYDTYGFPIELTREIAAEQGLSVDEESFAAAMEEQRERARAARQETGYLDKESQIYPRVASALTERGVPSSSFVGYDSLEREARVLAILSEGEEIDFADVGTAVEVVLDITPFYAESGGQSADKGLIQGPNGSIAVEDVKKPVQGLIVHRGKVTSGKIVAGEQVLARVDAARRVSTAAHHTATHLLHRALRDLLGEHAQQAGSLVTPERLRFDFSHHAAVNDEQLRAVERMVNARVRENLPVCIEVTSLEEARRLGATALFGEKYGDEVRTVKVGEYSFELCGGTHLARSGEIGLFKIVTEEGVAAGTRRIEAVTGQAALDLVEEQEDVLKGVCDRLKVTPALATDRVEKLLAELKEAEREAGNLRGKLSGTEAERLAGEAESVKGLKIIVAPVPGLDGEGLRTMGDRLRDKIGEGVIILGSPGQEKVAFLVMATPGAVKQGVHAGDIVKAAAQAAGGGGGGRPDMAQAGGKDPARLSDALQAARAKLDAQLAV
jgi:alanyl-tRNA synthetase